MRTSVPALPLLVAAALSGSGAVSGATVGPAVASSLSRSRTARVVVALHDPAPAKGPGAREAALAAVQDGVLSALGADVFRLSARWSALPGFAGEVTEEGLKALAEHPDVAAIDLDVPGTGHTTTSGPMVSADQVHALGFTGAGVVVAVLDSGVDASHPDLAGAVIAEQCYCADGSGGGCCPNGLAEQAGAGSAQDDHGHGTNVSGIIASRGTAAPKGIAPASSIVAVKVLDSSNSFSGSSQVLSGLNWLIASRPDVKVVNMSLGTSALFTGACDSAASYTQLFATAVNTLKDRGTSVFVSSGNNGSLGQMSCPACVASSVAVGAVYDGDVGPATALGCTDATTAADKVTCFSNTGTALDLLAPGAPITSAGSGGGTSTFHGTSQAAPHAAAGAALLLHKKGTLTPSEIENALKTTGKSVTDQRTGSVFKRIQLLQAVGSVTGGGGGGACTPAATTLCFDGKTAGDRRFKVQVEYQTIQGGGRVGSGNAVPTSSLGISRGGLFWFFSGDNPEMLVKVLDGCDVNSQFWFFSSAGTNVGLTTTVTDTATGGTKVYTNTDMTPAQPVQDIFAFSCN